MPVTSRKMKAQAERYFAAVDAGDIPAILATLTRHATLEVVTSGARWKGQAAIRAMFAKRFRVRASGWHGDFVHAANTAGGILATRFRVRSVDRDGTVNVRRNVNVFEFQGERIRKVQIWMSGASMLK